MRFRAVSGDPRRYGRVYVATDGRGLLYGDPKHRAVDDKREMSEIADEALSIHLDIKRMSRPGG